MRRRDWWPTDKITAVIMWGAIYTWFVFVLTLWYGTPLEPWVVAANQAWTTGLLGWAITEHRGDRWTR